VVLKNIRITEEYPVLNIRVFFPEPQKPDKKEYLTPKQVKRLYEKFKKRFKGLQVSGSGFYCKYIENYEKDMGKYKDELREYKVISKYF